MTQRPAASAPDHSDAPPARKQWAFRWGGAGALVQLLGVVGLGGAVYAGFVQTRGFLFSAAFALWAGAGLAFCLVALATGSELSKRYTCGHSGAPLPANP